jgi:uncharacterized protein DUF6953
MSDEQPTDAAIAAWMLEQLREKRQIYQEQVAWDLRRKYGKQFTYDNANGNPAISKSVLKEFNKLTKAMWSGVAATDIGERDYQLTSPEGSNTSLVVQYSGGWITARRRGARWPIIRHRGCWRHSCRS